MVAFYLAFSPTASGQTNEALQQEFPLMRLTEAQQFQMMADHFMAAKAPAASRRGKDFATSLSLLSRLPYAPAERNQGGCGNCWAWAGMGVMEIANQVQTGTRNRLSVQFINSCHTTTACCQGGWLEDVASFYGAKGFAVPWSNANAQWQSGNGTCSATPCGSIVTGTQYPISRIAVQSIQTHGGGSAQAIANIKAVLNQNRAIWFGFFMPSADWNRFFSFWGSQPETTAWSGFGCGGVIAGGHAVLCVGYNDEDPANPYWIMLNSWGTTRGRPNGLFRVAMNLDYDCATSSGFKMIYWQTLDLQFGPSLAATSFALNSGAANTTSRVVALNNSATGRPTEYLASEQATFAGAAWQPYSSAPAFTLSSGAGMKTVYFKLRNATAQSAVVSDMIQYGETASLADALDTSTLTWRSSGATAWYGQRAISHDGVDAAHSGVATGSQESWLETTVTGPGNLGFWWKVSSEKGFDFLRLLVDGAEVGKISGQIGWEQRTVALPAGAHSIRWCYTKDIAFSQGADAGWVDQVSFTNTPPATLVYVDWRNTTANPDGSLTRPFPTIAKGVTNVTTGGTVAIRAGTYFQSTRVFSKPLRLEAFDGRVLIRAGTTAGSDLTAAPIGQLSPPTRQADGSMNFHFATLQGIRYQVLTSTNLATWEVYKDFTAEEDTAELVVPDAATEPMRFFRVITP